VRLGPSPLERSYCIGRRCLGLGATSAGDKVHRQHLQVAWRADWLDWGVQNVGQNPAWVLNEGSVHFHKIKGEPEWTQSVVATRGASHWAPDTDSVCRRLWCGPCRLPDTGTLYLARRDAETKTVVLLQKHEPAQVRTLVSRCCQEHFEQSQPQEEIEDEADEDERDKETEEESRPPRGRRQSARFYACPGMAVWVGGRLGRILRFGAPDPWPSRLPHIVSMRARYMCSTEGLLDPRAR
jgi:hypothetical protein